MTMLPKNARTSRPTPARMLTVAVCALAVLLPGAVAGCASGPTTATAGAGAPASSGPLRVDVAEFAEVISSPAVQVIDVRTPEEFAVGHIAGAVNLPVRAPDFADRVAGLDRGATYAVYCRSGNRSQPAVAAMRDAGITAIYELTSGTNGWSAAGRALTQ